MTTTDIFRILLFLLTALVIPACSDDKPDMTEDASVSISVTMPGTISGYEITAETVEFKDISSGISSTFRDRNSINVEPGFYDIRYEAEVRCENGLTLTVKASASSVMIREGENPIGLTAYILRSGDDLTIAEIFFAGTQRSSGNNYVGDDYIKLYNNTDHTVFADGITIFESKFLTSQKYEYTPDIMNEAMTVDALYTIPGDGTRYPVEPGEYLLIADTGIDHRVANPYSFDLSHADFEWYDISSSPSNIDIDGPNVENLEKWYCYTNSFFMLHNRGLKAYGIARIPVNKETYLKDYIYTYEYEMVLPTGTFPMSQQAYRLPNEWIVDVVNLSIGSVRVWNVCHPSLDEGWTYCGTIDKDPTRFFKSVRRKMIGLSADGSPILQDTGNSSVDFNPECVPSEIERQMTAIDINGNKSDIITYDGVIPLK